MSGPPSAAQLAEMQHMRVVTLQALACALAVSSIILGIFLGQVLSFFRLFPHERWVYRGVVVALLLLQLTYFSLNCANVVQSVTDAIEQKPYSPFAPDIVHAQNWTLAGITWICEGYFTFLTVKIAAGNWPVRIMAVLLWCFQASAFLAWNIVFAKVRSFQAPELYYLRATGVWSLFGIATFTSSVLLYYLIVKREIRPSDDILTKFATVVVGTSSLLALIELIGAIGSLFRHTTSTQVMGRVLGSLYATTAACCVMFNLNHRAALRRPSDVTVVGQVGPFSGANGMSGGSKRSNSRWTGSGTGAAQVQVTMEELRREETGEADLDRPVWRERREEEGF